ncbi:MAG: SUMF1/EgtB/PvdO family nonheme iron enzyme [Phycisphaerales bacterium]
MAPRAGLLFMLAILASIAGETRADIDPLSGIDFVTVGAVGNAPWPGNGAPDDRAIGRGGVNYEYRIGKFEVTSAQWAEFYSAARGRSDPIPWVQMPSVWGGSVDGTWHGPGTRYRVNPGDEMRAAGGITWRTAAIYCNWLCNGKSSDFSAFMSGAYDVSTFGVTNGVWTDQPARTPGAAYFIPSLDEWIKSVHYDPNKVNPDGTTGGWWTRPNGTDTNLVYGPPPAFGGNGTGMANAGFTLPNSGAYFIPLGSYPTVQTPWGLLDAAGTTTEWTEEILEVDGGSRYRIFDGSYWESAGGLDRVQYQGGEEPGVPTVNAGFRIAAFVPAPAPGAMGVGFLVYLCARRKRGETQEKNGSERVDVLTRPFSGDGEAVRRDGSGRCPGG